jgi:hypothetical protein
MDACTFPNVRNMSGGKLLIQLGFFQASAPQSVRALLPTDFHLRQATSYNDSLLELAHRSGQSTKSANLQ